MGIMATDGLAEVSPAITVCDSKLLNMQPNHDLHNAHIVEVQSRFGPRKTQGRLRYDSNGMRIKQGERRQAVADQLPHCVSDIIYPLRI